MVSAVLWHQICCLFPTYDFGPRVACLPLFLPGLGLLLYGNRYHHSGEKVYPTVPLDTTDIWGKSVTADLFLSVMLVALLALCLLFFSAYLSPGCHHELLVVSTDMYVIQAFVLEESQPQLTVGELSVLTLMIQWLCLSLQRGGTPG